MENHNAGLLEAGALFRLVSKFAALVSKFAAVHRVDLLDYLNFKRKTLFLLKTCFPVTYKAYITAHTFKFCMQNQEVTDTATKHAPSFKT